MNKLYTCQHIREAIFTVSQGGDRTPVEIRRNATDDEAERAIFIAAKLSSTKTLIWNDETIHV